MRVWIAVCEAGRRPLPFEELTFTKSILDVYMSHVTYFGNM